MAAGSAACIRLGPWALLAAGIALVAPSAQAQFSIVPAPQCAAPRASSHQVEENYRVDAARHLHACYPMRLQHGKPALMQHAVIMLETEIDAAGKVLDIRVVRRPAADDVTAWMLAMIRRASPYPAPARMGPGSVKFTETYLVDKAGLFQALSLAEAQK